MQDMVFDWVTMIVGEQISWTHIHQGFYTSLELIIKHLKVALPKGFQPRLRHNRNLILILIFSASINVGGVEILFSDALVS